MRTDLALLPALVTGAVVLAALLAGRTGAEDGSAFGAEIAKRLGAARVVDLTLAIDERTVHWEEANDRPFSATIDATVEKDGYFARRFEMPEHYGTHVDAPAHFAPGKLTVDAIPPERLSGEAVVIGPLAREEEDPDRMLEPRDLERFEKEHGMIPAGAIVLFRSGWAEARATPAGYAGRAADGKLHFPGFSPEVARVLLERRVAAIGIDTLSIDRGLSETFDVHHVVCGANVYAVENLSSRIAELPARGAFIVILPLKLHGGSGAPARVVAFVP
jgi:kynurenine formamidase